MHPALSTRAARSARRLRSSRGTAYTETVIMIPFFVAVWSCMIYVHKAYSVKVSTMAEARRCVWGYAYEACQTAPTGCVVSTGVGSDAGSRPGAIGSFAGALGGLGDALLGTIFGQNANSRITNSVAKPAILGSGSTSVLAGASMMCNTQHGLEPADVAREAFCTFTGHVFC